MRQEGDDSTPVCGALYEPVALLGCCRAKIESYDNDTTTITTLAAATSLSPLDID